MFVNESLEGVLKPKGKNQIKAELANLNVDSKANLLWNKGMTEFLGSYDVFLDFLVEEVGKERVDEILSGIMEDHYKGGEGYADVLEWSLSNFNHSEIVDMVLNSLPEKKVDEMINLLIPGYLSESEVLKPKSKEEIDDAIAKIFDLQRIRNAISEQTPGTVLALYVWEGADDSTRFSKNQQFIINTLLETALEAYNNDWHFIIIVYELDPNRDGTFDSSRGGEGFGGVKLLVNMELEQTYEGKSKIRMWDV